MKPNQWSRGNVRPYNCRLNCASNKQMTETGAHAVMPFDRIWQWTDTSSQYCSIQ